MDAVVKEVKKILQPEAPLPKSEGMGNAILSFVQFPRVRAVLIRDVDAGVRKATSTRTGWNPQVPVKGQI